MRFNEILPESIFSKSKQESRIKNDRKYADKHIYDN